MFRGHGAGMAAALRALAGGSDRYEGPGRAGEDRGSDRTAVVNPSVPARVSEAEPGRVSDRGP